MIDIKKILSLPPAERDDEIRKLIVPKPWKHDYHCQIPMMAKGKNGWCYCLFLATIFTVINFWLLCAIMGKLG